MREVPLLGGFASRLGGRTLASRENSSEVKCQLTSAGFFAPPDALRVMRNTESELCATQGVDILATYLRDLERGPAYSAPWGVA